MPQANAGYGQYGFPGYPGFGAAGAAGATPGMPTPAAGAPGAGAVGSPTAPGADANAAAQGQQAQWGSNPSQYYNYWGGKFIHIIRICPSIDCNCIGYYGQPAAGGQADANQSA